MFFSHRPKYNFIQELDEDLKCAICSNVAEDPIQHVTCGKLFCKDCLGKHGNDKPCPHCKTEGAIFYPDTRSKCCFVCTSYGYNSQSTPKTLARSIQKMQVKP